MNLKLFYHCLIRIPLSFYRVSKGVRDLPGNFQSATSNVPSGTSVIYFALLLASGAFFVIIAFSIFLPVMVLTPQKFAICFTIGCALIIASLFALKGPKNQLKHMTSKEVLYILRIFLVKNFSPALGLELNYPTAAYGCVRYFLLVVVCFRLTYLFSLSLSETSFYIGIYWQHSRNNICFHGTS